MAGKGGKHPGKLEQYEIQNRICPECHLAEEIWEMVFIGHKLYCNFCKEGVLAAKAKENR